MQAFRLILRCFLLHTRLFYFLFLISYFLFSFCASAQEKEDNPELPPAEIKHFKHSVKAGAGLPVILSNYPFRKTMDGVFSAHGSADFSIYKPIIAGVYYCYDMFDNAELKGNKGRRPDITKGFISTAGAGIGYEKIFEDNRVLSIMVNTGYCRINYKYSVTQTDTVKTLLNAEAQSIGVVASYSVIIEETGSVGVFASYRHINHVFDYQKLNLKFEDKINTLPTQLLTLGVMFSFGY